MYIIPMFLSVIYLFCVFVFRIKVAQHSHISFTTEIVDARSGEKTAVISDTPDAEKNVNLGFKYLFCGGAYIQHCIYIY